MVRRRKQEEEAEDDNVHGKLVQKPDWLPEETKISAMSVMLRFLMNARDSVCGVGGWGVGVGMMHDMKCLWALMPRYAMYPYMIHVL